MFTHTSARSAATCCACDPSPCGDPNCKNLTQYRHIILNATITRVRATYPPWMYTLTGKPTWAGNDGGLTTFTNNLPLRPNVRDR